MTRLPIIQLPSAVVVYRGPASGGPFGTDPIVAITTGLDGSSSNRKTGKAAQLWILPANISPTEAQRSGDDARVCGSCPLRPINQGPVRCYVKTFQGPLSTWRKRRDEAPNLDSACRALEASGVSLRLGAYGDPAAIPERSGVVQALAKATKHVYGYTHAWRRQESHWLQRWCMASADTDVEAWIAWGLGWRTYRIADVPMSRLEVMCPFPKRGVRCENCGLCQGNGRQARSVTIPAH